MTPADERLSLTLIEALSRIWTKIRSLHSGVPPVVLLAAPANRGHLNVLGHFAALRWKGRREADRQLHEVVVVAEHLNRPAEEVTATLLHEAAHAINFERGTHDCSASQYHNRAFKKAAEILGLEVEQIPHYGYARTSMPSLTAQLYADEIEGLREVCIHRRPMGYLPGPGPRPPEGDDASPDGEEGTRSRSRKATCGCPFIIRVARQTMSQTSIRCERCGELFHLV